MASASCASIWPRLKTCLESLSEYSGTDTASDYRLVLRDFCQSYAELCEGQARSAGSTAKWQVEQEEEIALSLCAQLLEFYQVDRHSAETTPLTAKEWLHIFHTGDDEDIALMNISVSVLFVGLESGSPTSSRNNKMYGQLTAALSDGAQALSGKFRTKCSVEENQQEFLALLHCLSYLIRGRRPRVTLCDAYGSVFVPFLTKMMQATMASLEDSVLWWSDLLDPPEETEKDERSSVIEAPADAHVPTNAADLARQTQFSLSSWIAYLHIFSWNEASDIGDSGDSAEASTEAMFLWGLHASASLGMNFLLNHRDEADRTTQQITSDSSAAIPVNNAQADDAVASLAEEAGAPEEAPVSNRVREASSASASDVPAPGTPAGEVSAPALITDTPMATPIAAPSGFALVRANPTVDAPAPTPAPESVASAEQAFVAQHMARVFKQAAVIQRTALYGMNVSDEREVLDAFQHGVVRSGMLSIVLTLLRKLSYLSKALITLKPSSPAEFIASVRYISILTAVAKNEAMHCVHAIISLNGAEALSLYHFSGGPSIMSAMLPKSPGTDKNVKRNSSSTALVSAPSGVPEAVENSVVFLQAVLCLSLVLRFFRLAQVEKELTPPPSPQKGANAKGASKSAQSAGDAERHVYRLESVESSVLILSNLKPFIKWLFSLEEQDAAAELAASLDLAGATAGSEVVIRCVCDKSLGTISFPTDIWPWSNAPPMAAPPRSDVLMYVDISKYGKTDDSASGTSEYLTSTAQKAARCVIRRGFETQGLASSMLEWAQTPITEARLGDDTNLRSPTSSSSSSSGYLPAEMRWLFNSRRGRFCHSFFFLLTELVCSSCASPADVSIENIEWAASRGSANAATHDPLLSAALNCTNDSFAELETLESKKIEVPCAQVHYLLFIVALLQRHPVQTLVVAKHSKVWSYLIRAQLFLMSGQRSDCNMDYSGQPYITWKNKDASKELNSKDSDRMWNLAWRRAGSTPQARAKANLTYSYACVRDMTLELMSLVVEASYVDSHITKSKVESPEIAERMLECLRNPIPDYVTVHVLRWLQKFTFRYHDHRFCNASIWPILASKCVSICKAQIFSMQSRESESSISPSLTVQSVASNGNVNLPAGVKSLAKDTPPAAAKSLAQTRALFWPARVAAMQTIQLLMRLPECAGWMSCFRPNLSVGANATSRLVFSDGKGVKSGSRDIAIDQANARAQKHLVFLRLAMDSRCRAASLDILYAILHQCAQCMYLRTVSTSDSDSFAGGKEKESPDTIDEGTAHEIMAHDIISGLIRIISISAKIYSSEVNSFPSYGVKTPTADGRASSGTSCWSNYLDVHEGNIPLAYLSSSLDVSDSYGAAVGTLQMIISLNREPTFGRVHSLLFSNYGQDVATRKETKNANQSFTWQNFAGTSNIFNALLHAAESVSVVSPDSKWTPSMSNLIVKYIMSAVTALVMGNDDHKEQFRRLMISRHKVVNNAPMFPAASSTGATTYVPAYNYLVDTLLSNNTTNVVGKTARDPDNEQCVFETILVLIDMLLDGSVDVPSLRGYSSLNKVCKLRQGASIAAYNEIPNDGYGLFAEDNSVYSQSRVPVIRNFTLIPILLGVVPSVSEKLQYFILSTLNNLTRCRSLVNISKVLLMEPPIMELMLTVFPQISGSVRAPAIEILQCIGKRTVSVAHLKRMFRLLRTKNNVRPTYTASLLEAVEGMIEITDGPRNSLFFQGKDSGLLLPALNKFPSSNGFSFSTWVSLGNLNLEITNTSRFQVESMNAATLSNDKSDSDCCNDFSDYFSYAQAVSGREYRPVLLSLRTKSGAGIEILFAPSDAAAAGKPMGCSNLSLVVKIYSNKTIAPTIAEREIILQTGQKWHHIAASFSPAGYRAKSELILVINGMETRHKMPYPFPTSEPIPLPLIGACEAQYQPVNTHASFCGQLGAIYFFCEPIHFDYLKCIYKLGPVYSSLFNQNDHDSLGEVFDSDIAKVMENVLAPAIMFALNPGISRGNMCTDVTPVQNKCRWFKFRSDPKKEKSITGPIRRNFEANAILLSNTMCSATSDIRDALDCLGGIRVLLPLFLQLNLDQAELGVVNVPVPSAHNAALSTFEAEPMWGGVSIGESSPHAPKVLTPTAGAAATKHSMCAKIFEILFSVLRSTAENNKLLSGHGFLLISNLLERLPPHHVNMHTLEVLIAQSKQLSWKPAWHHNLHQHFLCNFRLWKHAPFEVQRHLFSYLLDCATVSTSKLFGLLTVQKLLDVLAHEYAEVVGRQNEVSGISTVPLSRSSSYSMPGLTRSSSRNQLKILKDKEKERENRLGRSGSDAATVANISGDSGSKDNLLPTYTWSNAPCVHLTASQHTALRTLLLQIVYILLVRAPETSSEAAASKNHATKTIETDIHLLVMHIALPSLDAQYKVEAMRVFLRLLTKDDVATLVLRSLSAKQDLVHFFSQINNGATPRLRLYALICVCTVVQSACRLGKLPESSYPTVPLVPRSSNLYNVHASKELKEQAVQQDKLFAPGFSGDPEENASVFMPGFTPVRRSKLKPDGTGNTPTKVLPGGKPHGIEGIDENADFFDENASSRRDARRASGGRASTYHAAQSVKHSDDIFSDLGMPMNRIALDFMWIVQSLLSHINTSQAGTGGQSQVSSAEVLLQRNITFQALQYTLHGESCKHLIHDIEAFIRAENSEKKRSMSGSTDTKSASAFDDILNEEAEDARMTSISGINPFADEMTLAAHCICIPMLLPAIVLFISNSEQGGVAQPLTTQERADALKFRTLAMVQLKMGLQSFSNHDAVLRTLNWQDYIFRFLSCEQQFQQLAHISPEEARRSRDLADIVIQLLCDIHVHAVRCGAPTKNSFISRPHSSQYIQVHKMTSRELLELLRDGGRGIGVSVIQETIFCLRCHAAMGSLNVHHTGMLLLEATVAVMKRENEYLADLMAKNERTKESNSELLGIQKKLMTLNIWLLADITLEFITIPPIQAAEKMPDTKHVKASKSAESSNNVSVGTSSALVTASPTKSSQDSMVDSPERRRNPDEPEAIAEDIQISASAESRRIAALEIYFAENRFLGTHAHSPKAVGLQKSFSEGGSVKNEKSQEQNAQFALIWKLVDSLLSLIGPMEGVANALNTNDLYDRFMLGLKVGFRLGRQVTNQMDASVEAMKSNSSNSPRRPSGLTTSSRETSLSKTVEKVFWVLLRVLLSTYLQGMPGLEEDSVSNVGAGSTQSAGIVSLERLSDLLASVQKTSVDYYRSESVFIAVRLAEELHDSKCSPSCIWFQRGIELIAKVCKEQRVYFGDKLNFMIKLQQERAIMTRRDDEAGDDSGVTGILLNTSSTYDLPDDPRSDKLPPSPPASPQPMNHAPRVQLEHPIPTKAATVADTKPFASPISPPPKLRDGPSSPDGSSRSSNNGDEASYHQQNLLLLAMCRASNAGENASVITMCIKLCLQSGSRSDELDNHASANIANLDENAMWTLWTNALQEDMERQQEKDDIALASRLTEMGLHRDAEQALEAINLMRAAEDACAAVINVRSDDASKLRAKAEYQRLRELRNSETIIAEKCDVEWSQIYYNLANDRGPWGSGALDKADLLWELDLSEDSQRMSHKIIPNPRGTRHRESSMASRASFSLAISRKTSGDMPTAGASVAFDSSIDDGASIGNADFFISGENDLDNRTTSPKGRGSISLGGVGDADDDLNALVASLARFSKKDTNKDNSQSGHTGDDSSDDSDSDDANEKRANGDGDSSDSDSGKSSSKIPGGTYVVNDEQDEANRDVDTDKNVLFSKCCEIIQQSTNYTNPPAYGLLEVTSRKIIFTRQSLGSPDRDENGSVSKNIWRRDPIIETLPACQACPSSSWNCADIQNILQRYYQLRFVGVELFFTNRRTVFINLLDPAAANLLQATIRKSVKPLCMAPFLGRRPITIIGRMTAGPHNLTKLKDAWVEREISNFEYLMKLNSVAGRTFNDLGQYPVFPWVLADYSSEFLDLRKKTSYRDLHWPIGAQSESQREQMHAKYADLEQAYEFAKEEEEETGVPAPCLMPPYHWGSHYSVPGFILWYLIRLEPFTSLHVQLQDGKFDKADRLFASLEATYRGCTTNPSDVKELIPELYYCPEVLMNVNRVDFGSTQKGEVIDSVKLPPWANDPYDFIFQHRLALESDYVSQNLHRWIDLIFGCRQRPPHVLDGCRDSVDACNVFFHLTYAGAVDLDDLYKNDRILYEQYICQIAEFGQTPAQLFSTPHEHRKSFRKVDIFWPIASIVPGVDTIIDPKEQPDRPRRVYSFKPQKISAYPVIFITECLKSDRLITVDTSQIVGQHSWTILSPDVVPPFKMKVDSLALEVSLGSTGQSMFSQISSTISSMSPMAGAVSHVLAQHKRISVPFSSQFSTAAKSGLNSDGSSSDNSSDVTGIGTRVRCTTNAMDKYVPVNVLNFIAGEEKLHTYQSTKPGSGRAYERMSRSDSMRSNSRQGQQSDFLAQGSQKRTNQQMLEREEERSSSVSKESRSRSNTTGHGGPTTFKSVHSGKPVVEEHLSSQLFAVLPAARLLFSVGHWDLTLQVTHLDTGRSVQAVRQHSDVITCVALECDFKTPYLVTGSADCTLQVWELQTNSAAPLGPLPLHILYGHDEAVTSVAISCELNVVVSGSNDGTIIIHSLREGQYIRSITAQTKPTPVFTSHASSSSSPSRNSPVRRKYSAEDATLISKGDSSSTRTRNITWVGVSKAASIVSYSRDDNTLCTYTLNGVLLSTKNITERLHCLTLSQDGNVLITGGDSCLVVLRWVRTLELANDGPRTGLEAVIDGSLDTGAIPPFTAPIRSIYLTAQEMHLIVGDELGNIRILVQDSDYLRQRLQRKLMEIGIL